MSEVWPSSLFIYQIDYLSLSPTLFHAPVILTYLHNLKSGFSALPGALSAPTCTLPVDLVNTEPLLFSVCTLFFSPFRGNTSPILTMSFFVPVSTLL